MKKLRTPIAAVFLLIYVVLNLVQNAEYLIRYFSFNYISVFKLVGYLALSCALFAKNRNNTSVVLLGLIALINALYLIKNFSIANLMFFLSYALLAVYALSAFEQTLIKIDFSKVNEAVSKLHYLPAVLVAVAFAINFIPSAIIRIESIKNEYYFLNNVTFYIIKALLPTIVQITLRCIALLSIGKWIKDPYTTVSIPENTTNGGTCNTEEYNEAYCGLGKHIVLCLFTCGIWYLIWTYRTTKYLNKAPNAEHYNPTSKLLLCMFIPFYQIYWFYKHGRRIDTMSKFKKLNNSDMATLCLILGIFIPIVACILMQDRINILCTTKATVEEQKANNSTTEELKEFKELLDSGVISQEEFDAKKKQLLGL